jgi:hypothetical protein
MKPKIIFCLALVLNFALWNVCADESDELSTNLQGLALNIHCTNLVFNLGDEIPVEFVISNHGTANYAYENRDYDRSGRMPEYQLTVKSADGKAIPDPFEDYLAAMGGGLSSLRVLHPGEFFTKTIPLNLWAMIKLPGQYMVTGAYLGNDGIFDQRQAGVQSDPINVTILPRTELEMDTYISDLTNQFAGINAAHGLERDPILMKLAFTCSPKIVPFMLNKMYARRDNFSGYNFWEAEALVVYVPHSDVIRRKIVETATQRGLSEGMDYVLHQYGCTGKEWRVIIGRSLAEDNPHSWAAGAMAAQGEADDTFVPRLIAIATGATNEITRVRAIFALAMNRTGESVKTLKSLLNDPNEVIRSITEVAIRQAYCYCGRYGGKPLRPDDFEKKLQRSANFSNSSETNSSHTEK